MRRPYEDLIGTLRSLNYRLLPGPRPERQAQRSGPEALYWIASQLQQAPLAWHPPDGYPDVASAWRLAGGLLDRWNMHHGLAGGWWPAKRPDRRAEPARPAAPAR